MNASMSPNTGPDAAMVDDRPLSIRDMQEIVERARDLICDNRSAYDDGVYVGEDWHSGKDIAEQLQRVEGRLWVLEGKLKELGVKA